jgi:hypothetical protein
MPYNYRDKSVDLVPRMNVTEYTPPNTDQTLPVPTAGKAIIWQKTFVHNKTLALTLSWLS